MIFLKLAAPKAYRPIRLPIGHKLNEKRAHLCERQPQPKEPQGLDLENSL